MPSVAARLVESAIWAFARNIRKATDDEVVRDVIQKLEKNAAPIVLPSTIRSTQETRQLQGNQEWQIFHVEPETHAREDKAIVFWHGGGFINNVDRLHHVALRKLANDFHIPVILPIYTLAPRATGRQFIVAAIDLLMQLRLEKRYKDREIVLVGDSAGGFLSLQLFVTLTNMACPGGDFDYAGQAELLERYSLDAIRSLRSLVTTVILFSAMTESDPPDEDRRIETDDPALRISMLRVVAKLWAYGVKAYPDRDFGIPTTMQEAQTYDLHPLNHPAHSPLAGIDSLARYMQADIASSPATIVHFCGTHDVLHPGNVRLHERLLALGPSIIETEFHSFPGLFHVFQGLDFLPESKKVWRTVERILM